MGGNRSILRSSEVRNVFNEQGFGATIDDAGTTKRAIDLRAYNLTQSLTASTPIKLPVSAGPDPSSEATEIFRSSPSSPRGLPSPAHRLS